MSYPETRHRTAEDEQKAGYEREFYDNRQASRSIYNRDTLHMQRTARPGKRSRVGESFYRIVRADVFIDEGVQKAQPPYRRSRLEQSRMSKAES